MSGSDHEHNGNAMEEYQRTDLCHERHEQLIEKFNDLKGIVMSHDKAIKGGPNGDGIGLIANVHANTKIINEWQAEMKKFNRKVYGLIIGVVILLVRDYLVRMVK